MSTILDALRKVEEEKRTQETDVRTRLLSSPPRFDLRAPRRSHVSSIVGGGLAIIGIICTAGLLLWHSSDTASVVDVPSPPTNTPQVAGEQSQSVSSPGPQLQRQAQPEPQPQNDAQAAAVIAKQQPRVAQVTPDAAAVPLPKESTPVVSSPLSSTPPRIAETKPRYDPWSGGNLPKAASNTPGSPGTNVTPRSSEATVQRSPFVNSPPYDQTVAPSPPPPPSERRVTVAAPKPVRPRPQTSEKTGQTTPPATAGAPPLPSSPAPASDRGQESSSPSGASLSFLQWSSDPEKRVASIKVGTGPSTIAHEGDSVEGLTIVKIHPDAVEVRSGESHFLLKAR